MFHVKHFDFLVVGIYLKILPFEFYHEYNIVCTFTFYPLDSRNTKKTKPKMLSFYKQQSYFSQIVSKKAKITTSFFMKNSKNNNFILVSSF